MDQGKVEEAIKAEVDVFLQEKMGRVVIETQIRRIPNEQAKADEAQG